MVKFLSAAVQRRERGRTLRAAPVPFDVVGLRVAQLMAEPTELNLLEAARPRNVMATMQTTAIRATRSAYSTSEAPRSVLQRACSQALAYSYEVSIWDSPLGFGADEASGSGGQLPAGISIVTDRWPPNRTFGPILPPDVEDLPL